MKRPLPPELVRLGDELETAARRSVVDRPVRRQLALNALATLVITVPLGVAATGAELARPVSSQGSAPAAEVRSAPDNPGPRPRPSNDRLPRDLRRLELIPQTDDLLVLPSHLRPALR